MDDVEKLREKLEEKPIKDLKIHKDMKWWIAKKYFDKGVPVSKIEFEYRLQGKEKNQYHTIPDVFIKHFGGVAIYCQTHNKLGWMYKFLEDALPILRQYSEKQTVVLPKNVGVLNPDRRNEFNSELRKHNVEMMLSPFKLDIEDVEINLKLGYRAVDILTRLNKEYSPEKDLSEFIESDLEKLINKNIVLSTLED